MSRSNPDADDLPAVQAEIPSRGPVELRPCEPESTSARLKRWRDHGADLEAISIATLAARGIVVRRRG